MWPGELTHVALCRALKCSWREMEETPAIVRQDELIAISAEAEASAIRARWDNL